MARSKRSLGNRIMTERMDYSMLLIVLFLIVFGLVMIYSTSSYEANMQLGESTYYLRKQLTATVIGIGFMLLAWLLPHTFYERFAFLPYLVSCVLIMLVRVPALAYSANGATRWIRIGSFTLQPAEVAKVGIIMFEANLLCHIKGAIRTTRGLLFAAFCPIPMAGLVYVLTNNLSSAIIIVGIAWVMIFVSSPEYKKFGVILLAMAGFVAAAVFAIVKVANSEGMGFRFQRILAWLDPEAYANGKGFQTLQALYAIGSGGIFGKGLGQSMQKLGYLPEAQNDMIFSIICEELGLFGAFAIMIMFILLIWRFVIIAYHSPDMYGALVVTGVIAHIAIQVILNIAVVTNIMPNTGISLPFISYGGSSVVFLLAEMGMVLSVSRAERS